MWLLKYVSPPHLHMANICFFGETARRSPKDGHATTRRQPGPTMAAGQRRRGVGLSPRCGNATKDLTGRSSDIMILLWTMGLQLMLHQTSFDGDLYLILIRRSFWESLKG